MLRTSWDQTWLDTATALSHRSLCYRAGVGAVVVSADNRYVTTGYNGPPAHYDKVEVGKDCRTFCERAHKSEPESHYHDCPSIHAEANALLMADRSRIEGGSIYITTSCCWDCGKLIANSGLARVVMKVNNVREAYRNPDKTIALLRDSGLEVGLRTP